MNNYKRSSHRPESLHAVERNFVAELHHFKKELAAIDPLSRSEHDVWYRDLLERMIDRRSHFISTVFRKGQTAQYA